MTLHARQTLEYLSSNRRKDIIDSLKPMTSQLTFRLLGKPQVELDGAPVTGFISAKAQALLYYLVVTGHPHTRAALAGLLWGDMADAQAGKNLRNALSNLRSLVGPYLLIARDQVALNPDAPHWTDVKAFVSALGDKIWEKDLATLHRAVELYQGDFLEGFYVGEALAMEEWILGRRSLMTGLVIQALQALVLGHLEREEYAAGIEYANRLLAIEPWREETHRQLMLLLAKSRQRSAALAQYETCRKVLKAELDAEPMPETTALYQRIKSAAAPLPHNLPPQLTPMVGRQSELAEISRFFANPNEQLLTLVGPGGIGKTYLALQAASRCIDSEISFDLRFSDGVFFVPLAGIGAGGAEGGEPSLVSAMADAFKISFQGPVHPQAQLLSYLRDKDILLILDNFDHLIGAARQLGDILRLAPKVKLLVTSRVRLNLQDEWLLELKGLDCPSRADIPAQAALAYSAVALFVQQARRVQAGFVLSDAETPDVIRICQLMEGVPLGIELAASWVRVLSCKEIAAEIEKSIDFLTSALQDVSERHRSLRAVFDHSWNLLSSTEQQVFRRLAVFRGGFQREAAAQVVGVSLPLLAGLVDKSLLRRNATGRYEVHDLLRQYAEEILQTDAAECEQVNNAHCCYYAALISAHREQLKGEEMAAALAVLDAERENVRAAWNWAVSHRMVEQVNLFMECL